MSVCLGSWFWRLLAVHGAELVIEEMPHCLLTPLLVKGLSSTSRVYCSACTGKATLCLPQFCSVFRLCHTNLSLPPPVMLSSCGVCSVYAILCPLLSRFGYFLWSASLAVLFLLLLLSFWLFSCLFAYLTGCVGNPPSSTQVFNHIFSKRTYRY